MGRIAAWGARLSLAGFLLVILVPAGTSGSGASTTEAVASASAGDSSAGGPARAPDAPLGGQDDDAVVVVDPALYQAMDYRLIGPFRGGRVTAVAGVRQDPRTYYMGSTGGGVWKTTDGGEIWRNVTDGSIAAGSIGAVAVAPSDPEVVYVGTGSACPRGNVSTGRGMYRSTDGGDTWTFVGLPRAGQIGRVVVDPDQPDRVYVAALGNVFGPNEERGVYRSVDGGDSWEKVLYLSERTGAVDLAMNPSNPRILYAGMWRVERKPWTLIDGNEEGGVYRSVDGGDTWARLSGGADPRAGEGTGDPAATGLPGGLLGRIGVTVSPADPDRVWVIQQHAEEEKGGVYRSDDGGDSWRRINGDHKLRQRGWYYSHIHADPRDDDTVYVLNTGFYRSIDGGRTFDERIDVPHGDNHDLWIHPDDPEIMIEANDGGANVSYDGGASWSTQRNQPTAEFYRVTVDNAFPYRVYGAQQDNSTISVPSRSPGGITPKQHWYSVGGGESGHVAVDPRDPDVVWAGTYSGEITRVDRDKWFVRQVTEYPHYTEGWEMRDLKYRFQWNAPIEISPHDPDVVYHTSQYVHRTTDGGQTWEIISPDLTTPEDEHMGIPGGPIQHDATGVEVYSSIFAFAASPHEPALLWAGTDDGHVHVSPDGGDSWREITPEAMPDEGTVNAIELSSRDPDRAILSVFRYRQADFRPYVFLTEDRGESWELLTRVEPREGRDGAGDVGAVALGEADRYRTNGIPADHFVRVVREDPERQGLLYAGTEFGVYVSFDDGDNWQSLQLDLPVVPVTDMAVHEGDLVLSTQGRSFWILDDLTPLHQLTDAVARRVDEEGAHLFRPRTAHRTGLRGFDGPRAPDPIPTGAAIGFLLDESLFDDGGSTGPSATLRDGHEVTLEILDADGDVVRTFTTSPEEGAGEKELEVEPGMNVREWDLRYPGPDLVPDLVTMVMRNPQPGPRAPTGSYRARLSVARDGAQTWSRTEAFELETDPRWTVSDADLQAQFDLAIEIRDTISESQRMVRALRSIREQAEGLAERVEAASGTGTGDGDTGPAAAPTTAELDLSEEQVTAIREAADRLVESATGLEERLIQNRIESRQDAIGMERRFTNHIGRLFTLLIGEDHRPTGGILERWRDVQDEFEGYRERFRGLLDDEVAAFNRTVDRAGLPAVLAASPSP